MSYRKLLVGLADPETAPRVMNAASALARTHAAHLLVVHVVPGGVTHEDGVAVAERVERLQGIYEAAREATAFTSEWRTLESAALSVGGALAELGNACDALVLAQRHGREAGRSEWHLGEHLVGVGARPMLLVPDGPDAAERPFSAERVLVGWDGGAVATRAAFDALPLLLRAQRVRVHRFNRPTAERRHVTGVSEAFVETLARHGVSVELSHGDVSRFEVGEELLALADEDAADVLVTGCRRHARVRGFLFGDTTRHVLEHASRPVLMGG